MDTTEYKVDAGELPAFQIRIDRDGTWYYNGMEMFRKDIVGLFYQCLEKDEQGRHVIILGDDRCVIEVEDAPYVVRAVYKFEATEGCDGVIQMVMNDLSVEDLDISTLRIGSDNVPYCTVRDGKFEARFSRAGYYQLAEHIDFDPDRKAYYISLNDTRHYIQVVEDHNASGQN